MQNNLFQRWFRAAVMLLLNYLPCGSLCIIDICTGFTWITLSLDVSYGNVHESHSRPIGRARIAWCRPDVGRLIVFGGKRFGMLDSSEARPVVGCIWQGPLRIPSAPPHLHYSLTTCVIQNREILFSDIVVLLPSNALGTVNGRTGDEPAVE